MGTRRHTAFWGKEGGVASTGAVRLRGGDLVEEAINSWSGTGLSPGFWLAVIADPDDELRLAFPETLIDIHELTQTALHREEAGRSR